MTQLSTPRAQRQQYTHIGLAMTVLILLSVLLPNLTVLILQAFWPAYSQHPLAVLLVNYGLLYLLAYPYIFLWLRLRTVGVPPQKKLKFTQFLSAIPVCLVLSYVGNLMGNLCNNFIGLVRGEMPTNDLEGFVQSYDTWLIVLFVVILGPVLEELIFRKAITDALYPLGETVCVCIGALIFGLMHGNFYQFFYAALLGGLFTLIYCRTGKLRYTIVLHMLVNFQGSVIAPLILQQAEQTDQDSTSPLAFLLTTGYNWLLLALMALGVVLLIRGWKTLQLRKSAVPLEHPVRNALLNPGMVIFFAAAAVMIVIRL